jgi:uncharacterized protein
MRGVLRFVICVLVIAAGASVAALRIATAAQPAGPAQRSAVDNRGAGRGINRGVVELMTGRAEDGSVRMAEEIAGIVDDGATRRVVPLAGKGSLQNIADLKYLRGVDIAILPVDALEYARDQHLFPGIEDSLTYIAKLYNQELHLLARSDIKNVADLSGQIVNVDVRGSGTALTAGRLFNLLGVSPRIANDNQNSALQKLRNGEIAALAFVAAKPAPFFQAIDATDGLHLLGIPLTPAVIGAYVPSRITADDYPRLVAAEQSTDTVAVGTVMVATEARNLSDRYRNIADFIDALFTNFQGLLAPGHHPKWREVNLAAALPGWMRHPVARQWLNRNAVVAGDTSPESLQLLISRFIDERRQNSGGAPMSDAGKK